MPTAMAEEFVRLSAFAKGIFSPFQRLCVEPQLLRARENCVVKICRRDSALQQGTNGSAHAGMKLFPSGSAVRHPRCRAARSVSAADAPGFQPGAERRVLPVGFVGGYPAGGHPGFQRPSHHRAGNHGFGRELRLISSHAARSSSTTTRTTAEITKCSWRTRQSPGTSVRDPHRKFAEVLCDPQRVSRCATVISRRARRAGSRAAHRAGGSASSTMAGRSSASPQPS